MSICYQLIGVPGSGKTTWAQDQLCGELKHCAYASTDIWVEKYANSVSKTYSEVFDHYMPAAVRLMTLTVIRAKNSEQDIIWDQTSTTAMSRRKKFNLLPDYRHIAIVFPVPEPEELNRRLAQRSGKIIPPETLERMIFNMSNETVSLSEGFMDIIKL